MTQIPNCLTHWNFEFGYCLLFVVWCLEFSESKTHVLQLSTQICN